MKFLDFKAKKPIFDFLCSSLVSFRAYAEKTIISCAKVCFVSHYVLHT